MSHTVASLNAALEDRYRIERELGAGGMATVYLAEDVRHERQVAIKVLKPELVAIIGAERFLAEIKTTANLQHPHILPLHDSGEVNGVLYYVMPYVEGESLRGKLDREQQLPVDESVRIAVAVAGALDYAHSHGVIHRDIKPANILLHGSEPVVADFGIALAVGAAGGSRLTETGLSVGTLQYMSPEQAVGDREIDGRSDLYSLATTLYELLVGEPPFNAPTPQAVVGRIISQAAPSAVDLRETVPPHIARAIQKALAKLPADRFQTGADFADALARPGATAGLTFGTHEQAAADPAAGRLWKVGVPAALAIAALGFAAGAQLTGERSSSGVSDPVEFVMRLGERMNHVFAISEDGRRLAFSGADGGLLTRTLSSPQVSVIPSSDGRVWGQPTFSPDGEWVAFLDLEEGELRRVPFRGGTPVTIASVPLLLLGMSWGPDDTIVWGRGFSGLWSVAVDGGAPVPLTVPDTLRSELGHWDPQFLPGGTSVLFTTYRVPIDSATVEILDLDSGERTVLFKGGVHARYAPTGHILYSRGEALWAVPFDASRRRVEGSPIRVLEGVSYDPPNARGGFQISASGTLVYWEASAWNIVGDLTWVDRRGSEQSLGHEPGVFTDPDISPDGRHAAVVRNQSGSLDVWVYEVDQPRPPARVTRGEGLVANPIWTPDGQELIYSQERRLLEVFRKDWQSGAPEASIRIAEARDVYAYAVTTDGRLVIASQGASWDIWTVPLEAAGPPADPLEFRVTEFHEMSPSLSSDGRWVAYVSTEAGAPEIWVHPYPPGEASRRRRQITRGGGNAPMWGVGGELFYRLGQSVMSVRVDLSTGVPGTPVELVDGPYSPGLDYAVDPSGDRFLMIKPQEDGSARSEVVVVLNWLDRLESLMGSGS